MEIARKDLPKDSLEDQKRICEVWVQCSHCSPSHCDTVLCVSSMIELVAWMKLLFGPYLHVSTKPSNVNQRIAVKCVTSEQVIILLACILLESSNFSSEMPVLTYRWAFHLLDTTIVSATCDSVRHHVTWPSPVWLKYSSRSSYNGYLYQFVAVSKYFIVIFGWYSTYISYTYPFNGPFSGTTRVRWYQKGVKPIWIILKQETVSGSGISWPYASLHLAPDR